jgi:predicted phosphodiesterase
MRVLAIGDPHEPCCKAGYLEFCQDMYEAWDCDTVVCLGDIIDWHGISFHAAHPEAPGVMDEYNLILAGIQKWKEAFPVMKVCVGNHDERVIRLAESVKIPKAFLKDYKEMWQTPEWDWGFEHVIDDTLYIHGTACGSAAITARQMAMSVVMGHFHSKGGIEWFVNPVKRWFGMNVGCGVDDKTYSQAYGKHMRRKSVISCGVVIDGVPYHEMMPLENYK